MHRLLVTGQSLWFQQALGGFSARHRSPPERTASATLLFLLLVLCPAGPRAAQVDPPQAFRRGDSGPRRVFRDRITPHWFAESTRFWYRNDLRAGTKEFVVVDAERGTREFAFDHAKLAAKLSTVAGAEYQADKLPFNAIEFFADAKSIRFKVGDVT